MCPFFYVSFGAYIKSKEFDANILFKKLKNRFIKLSILPYFISIVGIVYGAITMFAPALMFFWTVIFLYLLKSIKPTPWKSLHIFTFFILMLPLLEIFFGLVLGSLIAGPHEGLIESIAQEQNLTSH
jgi:hypothetical protein